MFKAPPQCMEGPQSGQNAGGHAVGDTHVSGLLLELRPHSDELGNWRLFEQTKEKISKGKLESGRK